MRLIRCILVMMGNVMPMRIRTRLFRAAGMTIGRGTLISKGLYVDRPEGIIIGDDCFLNHFIHLHNGVDPNSKIIIGHHVYIGPEATFICASHEIGSEKQRAGKNIYSSIFVEDGVWIGANTTIFPGVTIGQGGVIGASSVVTKSTERDKLYYGTPAKEVRKL